MLNYNTTIAFLETLKFGGVDVVFTNYGSDHPSFLEATAAARHGQEVAGKKMAFPQFISVPHEFVAVSAAQGYYQATGKVAGVIVHVDCGLQNIGGGIHNLWRGKIPCIIFSGLSPITQEGELPGSRTEFIHWVQDTPDQQGIVRGYSKFSYEIRTGANVAQVTLRALQLAQTEPKGPVYLFGSREIMEQEIPKRVPLNMAHWQPVPPPALPPSGVQAICEKLLAAKNPLVVTSWLGRSYEASEQLVKLAECLEMPVLDATPFNINFPTQHRLYAGSKWNSPGVDPYLAEADLVLLLDSDTPWAAVNKPTPDAFIIHIDQDPLKNNMPLFYVPAEIRYTASTAVALEQINAGLLNGISSASSAIKARRAKNDKAASARQQKLAEAAAVRSNGQDVPTGAAPAIAVLSKCLPKDYFILSESITNFGIVLDHIGINDARRYATSAASCLGYHGGAAVGAKYGFKQGAGRTGSDAFVCAISGDGSFMFSIPSVVKHLAAKISTPYLQVILANGGWKAPLSSALAVHPHGYASKAKGLDLGIMFGPRKAQPDFIGLCIAAAGGPDKAWGKVVISGSPDMEASFKEAVEVVQGGRQAVIVLMLPDLDS